MIKSTGRAKGKRLKARRKFKAHGDNPLKQYRRKLTNYQVLLRAECARQARLNDRTPAELAFEELLKQIGVVYEKEFIVQNGDRFVLLDYYIKGRHLCFEIDGSAHKLQSGYDEGRTAWLAESGIRVVRFTNKQVLKNPEETITQITEALKCQTPNTETTIN